MFVTAIAGLYISSLVPTVLTQLRDPLFAEMHGGEFREDVLEFRFASSSKRESFQSQGMFLIFDRDGKRVCGDCASYLFCCIDVFANLSKRNL